MNVQISPLKPPPTRGDELELDDSGRPSRMRTTILGVAALALLMGGFWSQIAQWSLRRIENADFTSEVIVDKGEGISWDQLCKNITELAPDTVWRHNQAGDLPGEGNKIDIVALRKHAGLLVPTPVQRATEAALADDDHVQVQKERYRARRDVLRAAFTAAGFDISHSQAGLYLWATRGED